MKKIIVLSLIFMVGFDVYAKDEKNTEIVISREQFSVQADKSKIAQALCRKTLSGILRYFEGRVSRHNEFSGIVGDVQYACKKIKFISKTYPRSQFTGSSGPFDHYYYYDTELTVVCEPRTLSEKQIYSAARSCEEQQSKECFEPEFLKRLDAVLPTEFEYSFSDKCALK